MAKHAGGRPTKYRPEFCSALIQHMSSGMSFESFAADVGCNTESLYEWSNKYPQFSNAKKAGTALGRKFWEKMGILGATGKIKNFNATVWIFTMKNRFGWRDHPAIPEGPADKYSVPESLKNE